MKLLWFYVCSMLFMSVIGGNYESVFFETFGGGIEYGAFVEQTSDQGYIVTGDTELAGNMDALLTKFDKHGNFEWGRTFGGNSDDSGKSVRETYDGGFVVTGYTRSFGAGVYGDIFLSKFDKFGNISWIRVFGGDGYDRGTTVQETTDKGFIVAGTVTNFGTGEYDINLSKFNEHGNMMWSFAYGGSKWDVGNDVQQTLDEGYIITGCTRSFRLMGSSVFDAFVSKLDKHGVPEWTRTIGGNSFDAGFSIVQDRIDRGYVMVGYTDNAGAGDKDVLIAKFKDLDGSLEFVKTLGGIHDDSANSIIQTSAGGFVVTGYTTSNLQAGYLLVFKMDMYGLELEFVKTMGGDATDSGQSVQQVSDGYVIVGQTASFGGTQDCLLVKTDVSGNTCGSFSRHWNTAVFKDWNTYISIPVTLHVTNITSTITITSPSVESSIMTNFIGSRLCSENRGCEEGYYGDECEVTKCHTVWNNDSRVCSDHGTCMQPDNCVCENGYFGLICGLSIGNSSCFGIEFNETEACGGEIGICIKPNTCFCTNDYYGQKCQFLDCFGVEKHSVDVCSGHGICLGHNLCKCDAPYNGVFCENWTCNRIENTDPQICNANGKCTSVDSCSCYNGYEGNFCDLWSCDRLYYDSTVCSGHGKCGEPTDGQKAICHCQSGFGGEFCETDELLTSLLLIFIPVSLIGCILLVFLVSLVMIISCCCIIILCCLFLIFGGSLSFFTVRQRQRNLEKYSKLDMILQEQLLLDDGDTEFANLRIDKKLFEIRYEEVDIKRLIGKGGSDAMVFLSIWKGQEVAFKVFKTQKLCETQDSFNQFEAEVSLLASLHHPNIIRFFGASLKPPRVGIVMEYCENGEILNFVKLYREKNGLMKSYPIEEKVRLIAEVVDALEYIHSRNIIHRDLKCENVLIDSLEKCKLMDFGISRVVNSFEQDMTKRIGTNIYISPEVMTGFYDEKCDIFSFAILVFIILTEDDKPYGKNNTETFQVEFRVANDPKYRPCLEKLKDSLLKQQYQQELQPQEIVLMMNDFCAWIVEIVERCWSHEPSERFLFEELSKMFKKKLKEMRKRISSVNKKK